jgi:hypothetical protein
MSQSTFNADEIFRVTSKKYREELKKELHEFTESKFKDVMMPIGIDNTSFGDTETPDFERLTNFLVALSVWNETTPPCAGDSSEKPDLNEEIALEFYRLDALPSKVLPGPHLIVEHGLHAYVTFLRAFNADPTNPDHPVWHRATKGSAPSEAWKVWRQVNLLERIQEAFYENSCQPETAMVNHPSGRKCLSRPFLITNANGPGYSGIVPLDVGGKVTSSQAADLRDAGRKMPPAVVRSSLPRVLAARSKSPKGIKVRADAATALASRGKRKDILGQAPCTPNIRPKTKVKVEPIDSESEGSLTSVNSSPIF